MARRRQRDDWQRQSGRWHGASDDALEATQRQSVPILPALDDAIPHAGTSPSTRLHTVAPSGPVRRTLAAATGLHPAPSPTTGTTGGLRSYGPRPAAQRTAAETVTQPQDAVRGAASGALDPTTLARPTLSLPDMTGADLPAVTPGAADRRVATRAAARSQTVFIRGSHKAPRLAVSVVPRRIGPRSFVAQFIIAMVTVMTLFSVLALVSPLGRSAVFAGRFQAYANSAPLVPTPTPKPKPTPKPNIPPGANPGQQAIINDIVAVFGSYAQGAINVARCESDFDPNARNPYPIGNSHAEGVFQILYPSTWDGTSYAGYSPYNYDANIHAAYQIFSRDGHTWREWACQP